MSGESLKVGLCIAESRLSMGVFFKRQRHTEWTKNLASETDLAATDVGVIFCHTTGGDLARGEEEIIEVLCPITSHLLVAEVHEDNCGSVILHRSVTEGKFVK